MADAGSDAESGLDRVVVVERVGEPVVGREGEHAGGRAGAGAREPSEDRVAAEEPLEIRLGGAPFATVMRTPGHDLELVRGLLHAEGLPCDELLSLRHCSRAAGDDVDEEHEGNVVRATFRDPETLAAGNLSRRLFASASCGVCGKTTIDAVLAQHGPRVILGEGLEPVSAALLAGLETQVRGHQRGFERTGGLHAAALFDVSGPTGELLVLREDVGRHNAVDKVVGHALETGGWDLSRTLLWVSGRVSFEVAQKAVAAGVPLVAALSAPTSLSVSLAERAGMTLVAFLRGRRFNVYGLRERIA